MNIVIKNEPFPHIIIENYFTEEECLLIWKEIDFLFPKLLNPSGYYAAKKPDGEYFTNSLGIQLEPLYSNRDISDILRCSSKIFNREISSKFEKINEYWYCIDYSTSDVTKLRYYDQNAKYEPHRDPWVNVIVSTTFAKNEFSGGDLYFPVSDYLIKSKHNRTVIFPGWVQHCITEVEKNSRFAITKFIHCSHSIDK